MVAQLVRRFRALPDLVTSVGRDAPRWLRDQGPNARADPLETGRPWWNYAAVRLIEQRLPQNAEVFEFGSGASTLWLTGRGARVTSVEHDAEWAERVRPKLAASGNLRFISVADGFSDYVRSIETAPDGSFDLVIVDGRERVACGRAAMPKVKPGGMLLLDDSYRESYRPLHEALGTWPVVHCRGLKPGLWSPVKTTIWTKPG